MGITYRQELITPQRARQLLGVNHEDQRGLKKGKIPQYGRDIAHDRWDSNTAETVKVDINGNMIDGQNRMSAVLFAADLCAKEGRPFDGVYMTVAYDVPTSAMKVIDTGAARGAADIMSIVGATRVSGVAAIVRWVLMWDMGARTGGGGNYSPTHSEILEAFQADAGAYTASAARGKDAQNRGLCVGRPAGVAHYLFARIDTEEAAQFFDHFISGANLPEFHPVATLRNRFIRIKMDRITPAEQLALFVRAWNGVRRGESLKQLIIVGDGSGKLTSANFPGPR